MAIFQKSVIKKSLATLDKDQLDSAFKTFKNNFSLQKIELIKELKEEKYQNGFSETRKAQLKLKFNFLTMDY